jgi:hypothetical protein
MAEWVKQQAEREAEKEQKRLERLQRKLAEPKHCFTNPDYQQQCHEMAERLEDSVLKGESVDSSVCAAWCFFSIWGEPEEHVVLITHCSHIGHTQYLAHLPLSPMSSWPQVRMPVFVWRDKLSLQEVSGPLCFVKHPKHARPVADAILTICNFGTLRNENPKP